MARNHWLVKSEPDVYSIEDLARDGESEWWGIRNYQARNFMRDMEVGDPVLFYHSNADVLGVYGVAAVSAEAHPDSKQFEAGHRYHDPKSDPDDPRWWCVDLKHVETFDAPVTRDAMREEPGLADMVILRRGSRLSITPVTKAEFDLVRRMAGR